MREILAPNDLEWISQARTFSKFTERFLRGFVPLSKEVVGEVKEGKEAFFTDPYTREIYLLDSGVDEYLDERKEEMEEKKLDRNVLKKEFGVAQGSNELKHFYDLLDGGNSLPKEKYNQDSIYWISILTMQRGELTTVSELQVNALRYLFNSYFCGINGIYHELRAIKFEKDVLRRRNKKEAEFWLDHINKLKDVGLKPCEVNGKCPTHSFALLAEEHLKPQHDELLKLPEGFVIIESENDIKTTFDDEILLFLMSSDATEVVDRNSFLREFNNTTHKQNNLKAVKNVMEDLIQISISASITHGDEFCIPILTGNLNQGISNIVSVRTIKENKILREMQMRKEVFDNLNAEERTLCLNIFKCREKVVQLINENLETTPLCKKRKECPILKMFVGGRFTVFNYRSLFPPKISVNLSEFSDLPARLNKYYRGNEKEFKKLLKKYVQSR